MPDRPPHLLRACLVAVCCALAASIAGLVADAPADDAWIVLRYARNLLAGHGWCYEPGVVVNASTSVANTLLLALGGLLTGDLHRAQQLVFTLGLGGAAAALGMALVPRGARTAAEHLPAVVAMLGCLTVPLFWTTFGMESPVLLGAVVGTWWAWTRRRWRLAAAFAAAAALARPEGLLLAPLLVVDHLLRGSRPPRPPWRDMALLLGVPVAAWLVFSLLRFGALAPDTLAAKRAQAASGWWNGGMFYSGARRSLALFDARGLGLGYKPFVAVLVAALVVVVRARHRILPLLGWVAAVCVGYVMLGVPYYHWYAVPLHLGLLAALAAAWQIGWSATARRARPWQMRAVLLLAAAGWILLQSPRPEVRAPSYPHYREVGRWLAANAAAEARIGAVEIGCIGYRVWPRGIVDACGLVTPDVVPDLAAGRYGAWFERHRPEYVVLHVPAWEGLETRAEESAAFADYREVFRSSAGRARVLQRPR